MSEPDHLAQEAATLVEATCHRIALNSMSMADFYKSVGTIKSIVHSAFRLGRSTGYDAGWDAHVAMVDERVRELALTAEKWREQPAPDCEPW